MTKGKVAFITGASRGIGRACALELADTGFDIAITARTVSEGEAREHSSTLKASDASPLPGSLDSTSALISRKGVQAFTVAADLTEPSSLGSAVTKVLERWGRIDVVVHNGRYVGPGQFDRFLETPIEVLRKHMEGNLFAPLIINQLVLPQMIARGSGTFVNITSASAFASPRRPAGFGGWGMAYSVSKGAFHRIAGILKAEHGEQGIHCFNVEPGFVATERIQHHQAKAGGDATKLGAPVEVPAKVVRWLCTDPTAATLSGETIEAQHFCHEHGLLQGWEGPKELPKEYGMLPDLSGYNLMRLLEGH